MPQPIKFESWDGVAAPKVPLGWVFTGGYQTSNTVALSPPNSLRYLNGSPAGDLLYYPARDAYNGNVRLKASFLFTGYSSGEVAWYLYARSNAAFSTYYQVGVEPAGSGTDGVTLYKSVNGVITQLGSTTGVGGLALNSWYTVQIILRNNTVAVYVQRKSDGYYLTAFGTYIASAKPLILQTDNAVSGSGYAALGAYQNPGETNPQYCDDFAFETDEPDPALLKKPRRRYQKPFARPVRRKRLYAAFPSKAFTAVLGPLNFWGETGDAISSGLQTACSPPAVEPTSPSGLVRYGLLGGPTVTVNPSTGNRQKLYFESEQVGFVGWPAGNWTVRLNVVRASPGVQWSDLYICRMRSGTSQGTIASMSGIALTLNPEGVYAVTLTGIADAAAQPGDTFYIICGFVNAPPLSVDIRLDQVISTPFDNIPIIIDLPLPNQKLGNSAQLRRPYQSKLRRKPRLNPALLTPQPPQTAPLPAALFRSTKRPKRFLKPFQRHPRLTKYFSDGIQPITSPPPKFPLALEKSQRKRKPQNQRRPKKPLRLAPLFPSFAAPPPHPGAMCGTLLIEESFAATALLTESLTATALLTESFAGTANTIIC